MEISRKNTQPGERKGLVVEFRESVGERSYVEKKSEMLIHK